MALGREGRKEVIVSALPILLSMHNDLYSQHISLMTNDYYSCVHKFNSLPFRTRAPGTVLGSKPVKQSIPYSAFDLCTRSDLVPASYDLMIYL